MRSAIVTVAQRATRWPTWERRPAIHRSAGWPRTPRSGPRRGPRRERRDGSRSHRQALPPTRAPRVERPRVHTEQERATRGDEARQDRDHGLSQSSRPAKATTTGDGLSGPAPAQRGRPPTHWRGGGATSTAPAGRCAGRPHRIPPGLDPGLRRGRPRPCHPGSADPEDRHAQGGRRQEEAAEQPVEPVPRRAHGRQRRRPRGGHPEGGVEQVAGGDDDDDGAVPRARRWSRRQGAHAAHGARTCPRPTTATGRRRSPPPARAGRAPTAAQRWPPWVSTATAASRDQACSSQARLSGASASPARWSVVGPSG